MYIPEIVVGGIIGAILMLVFIIVLANIMGDNND